MPYSLYYAATIKSSKNLLLILMPIFIFSKTVAQTNAVAISNVISEWSAWHLDTNYNENGEMVDVVKSKSKCASTTCHFVSVTTKYNNGKWCWKQKKKEIAACFGGGSKVIWTKKRKSTFVNKD